MKKNLVFLAFILILPGCDDESNTVTAVPEQPVVSQEVTVNRVPPAPPLQNVPWSWQYTVDKNDKKTTPDHPENYVLLLRPDGGVAVRADCNRGGSAFKVQEDGKIVLETIAMTKMLCPPESKGEEFLTHLHNIERYRIDGNSLMLILHDQSTMFFTPLTTP